MSKEHAIQELNQQVGEAIRTLTEIRSFKPYSIKGHWEESLRRWSTYFITVAAVLFVLLLALAGIQLVVPLPAWALTTAVVLGVSIQVIACLGLLLQSTSDVTGLMHYFKHESAYYEAEWKHSFVSAMQLVRFTPDVLETADRWLIQKIQAMERKKVMLFGGSDKLALLALIGLGWTVWKEAGSLLTGWKPSPLFFGMAFILGIILGGLSGVRAMNRLQGQRSILELARQLLARMESGAEQLPLDAPARRSPSGLMKWFRSKAV